MALNPQASLPPSASRAFGSDEPHIADPRSGSFDASKPYHLAYVFQRFPTFTQTFCVREVLELERQGIRPLIFSLRRTEDELWQDYPEDLRKRVIYLPDRDELVAEVRADLKQFPRVVERTLHYWRDQRDKIRVFEAAWIGREIQRRAPYLHHAHGHFAGMAARTMWWLHHFHDFTFSFTAHANDIFAPPCETEVSHDRLMHAASRIITVSDFSAKLLGEEFPRARHKVQRVYNGMDVEKWFQASQGRPEGIGSRRIYAVGRLIEKKGFADLIRSCAVLKQRKVHFSCHIIGEGPLESQLRDLIRELRLEEEVHLEGPQDQSAIIKQLSQRAHVFALPCVVEQDGGMDNLPTVIMEAMAVGLPCVSTRLAGVPEMVLEGKTGWLTDPHQPEAFANHLQQLLENVDQAREFGAAGCQVARERFDQSVTTAALKSSLISGGLVRFDLDLLLAEPDLREAYARQLPLWPSRLVPNSMTFFPKVMLAS